MTIPKPLYVAIRTKPIVYIICPKNIAKGKKILTMTRYEFKIVQILFPTLLTSRFDNNNNNNNNKNVLIIGFNNIQEN